MSRPKTNAFLVKLVDTWRDKSKLVENKLKSEQRLTKKLLTEITNSESKVTKLTKKLDIEKSSHEVTMSKLSKSIIKNKKLSVNNIEASNTIKMLKENINISKSAIVNEVPTQHSAVYWKKLYLSELARR